MFVAIVAAGLCFPTCCYMKVCMWNLPWVGTVRIAVLDTRCEAQYAWHRKEQCQSFVGRRRPCSRKAKVRTGWSLDCVSTDSPNGGAIVLVRGALLGQGGFRHGLAWQTYRSSKSSCEAGTITEPCCSNR